ncbi:MBOAT family protein [Massilia arenosa]|uniref:Probable alginate O-acetylase AlgI n=1 Tax=Zemynaea arenosa TaxID=2561931 RepID=A0A4Y9S344_9BURK|nr:MBOAT family protein [Massilia arenosa]TFW15762.1 MBOAT family protein [Massilia arenosa]
MLFNSFGFLFFYLPVVLGGYFLAGRLSHKLAIAWLALASLFFYGWWDVRFLPLLLGSILFNYAAARTMAWVPSAQRKRVLVAAIAADLGLLAWFKYADFLLQTMGLAPLQIVLPIGISFFTFTQIAFLVDSYRREVSECRLTHYALFVSYFPHLVAGPVLHHKEMMPQFADPANARPRAADLAIGLTTFAIGLGKKVLIADNLAPLANPVFAAGADPALIEAWVGVLAYTFQLYFDFSGYSDMAIGLSRMFRVQLPLNFDAPYKACDIAEFWRRWHMTLSRFLRDYLYIPLGGNRGGELMRYRNLMLTMLLGGHWHGAGWTFVAWGGLHGAYLVVHRLWQQQGRPLPRGAAHALTFAAVVVAWIFFRAPDFATAGDVLQGLVGGNGIALPHGLQAWASWLSGASFDGVRWIELEGAGLPALALAAVLAFGAPTTQEIVARRWRPSPGWSLACTALLVVAIFNINRPTDFLYFQF